MPQAEATERAQKLMNAVLPFAEQMLGKHGEFFPYAGVITVADEVQLVQFTDPGNEAPSAKEVHAGAIAALREDAANGDYKTTALVANVTVPKPDTQQQIDAVSVMIDDHEGYSLVVFFPYTLNEGSNPEFGEAFMQPGGNHIFGPAANDDEAAGETEN